MAFHSPAQAARRSGQQRRESYNHGGRGTATATTTQSAVKQLPEDEQWVLFPYDGQVRGTPRLSLVSETNTDTEADTATATSGNGNGNGNSNVDVLDAHLGDFGGIAGGNDATESVLPRHDGLGTFGWHLRAREELQQHIRALESIKSRRGVGEREGDDKRTRIEEWRVEQSRFLEAEIRRETRAMRDAEEDEEKEKGTGHERTLDPIEDVRPGFWARIMDMLLGRLVGMDQEMLEIIMGEKLPEHVEKMPRVVDHARFATGYDTAASTWEQRLVKCVVYELGTIFTRLSHPFGQVEGGSYEQDEDDERDALSRAKGNKPVHVDDETDVLSYAKGNKPVPADDSTFLPTLTRHKHHSLDSSSPSSSSSPITTDHPTIHPDCVFTKHEWERQFDINLVFRYFRSRLLSVETKTSRSCADMPRRDTHGDAGNDTLSRHTTSTASALPRRGTAQSIGSTCNYWDLAYDAVSLGSGSLVSLGEV